MKVVKLDRRHKYFKYGYTHALRFESWCYDAGTVERYLYNTYPDGRTSIWRPYFGSVSTKSRYKIYWICVRNESLLTMAILAM